MLQVSALVLTKNSAKHLSRCLESLQDFHEVIVYDSGSTDSTESLSKSFTNVTFIKDSGWQGFGVQRQKGIKFCTHEWIFWIDSDEVVTPELLQEIKAIDFTDTNKVYRFWRRNHFGDKVIKGTDWEHDKVVRLFSSKKNSFNNATVHEGLVLGGEVVIKSLQGKLDHYPYETIMDFFEKSSRYTDLSMDQSGASSHWGARLHGAWSFFRNYFLRSGFRDGYEGFVISYLNGFTATLKHLKIIEANKSKLRLLEKKK